MPYRITKTYGHDLGLSACFRQHRAQSHCRFLHGYPLSFKFMFGADHLDQNNWVLDFGGLKPLKAWLCDTFDHRLLVAEDDPLREDLMELANIGLADPKVVSAVGCEGFAKLAFDHADDLLGRLHAKPRVRLLEVEVREHGANSAIYTTGAR